MIIIYFPLVKEKRATKPRPAAIKNCSQLEHTKFQVQNL